MVDFSVNVHQRLEPFAACVTGDPFASLMVVKGKPGAAERAGKPPFSGDDGLALDKAFGRLGWGFGSRDTRRWFGVLLATAEHPALSASQLRLICEVIDPLAIVVLDEEARVALLDAFSPGEADVLARFSPGAQVQVLGRQLVSVTGFEEALTDEAAKQRVWVQLKRCTFPLQ